MKKNISLNMIFALILQIVTILSGLIVPRLIIQTFGSHTNGLISSLNQFFNYIALLEGGVASVMMANLYKPLHEKDRKKISSLVVTMKSFFKKISFIFLAYLICVSCFYPLLVDTGEDWVYVASLAVIIGANLFVQYNISITYRLLLNADNKIYITSIIQIIIVLLNIVLVYIGIKIYPNIHFIKVLSLLILLFQPISYSFFVKKYYDLDNNEKKDEKSLSQRWDGFGINLAYFIHNNTDITILTIFSTLINVSVYYVYHFVVSGIKSVVTAILSGIIPSLGKKIAKGNEKELSAFFDYYEYFSFSLTTILFTIGSILIVPFVIIYTSGIKDANYNQPVFAIILVLAEFFFCLGEPYVNIAYQSGHFRQISKYAYIEALINIVISICLVFSYGMIGIAIGTLAATFYKTISHVFYAKNNLLKRKTSIFFRYMIVSLLIILISNIICYFSFMNFDYSLLNFVIRGILSVVVTMVVFIVFNYIVYKKEMFLFLKKLLNKKRYGK